MLQTHDAEELGRSCTAQNFCRRSVGHKGGALAAVPAVVLLKCGIENVVFLLLLVRAVKIYDVL